MDPGFRLRITPRARRVETRANALMALHGIHDTRNVFSPRSSDLPVGRFVDPCVQPPFAKIFRFTRRANHLYKFGPSHPTRGALAIVTNAGRDAVDAAAFCVRRDRRAGFGL